MSSVAPASYPPLLGPFGRFFTVAFPKEVTLVELVANAKRNGLNIAELVIVPDRNTRLILYHRKMRIRTVNDPENPQYPAVKWSGSVLQQMKADANMFREGLFTLLIMAENGAAMAALVAALTLDIGKVQDAYYGIGITLDNSDEWKAVAPAIHRMEHPEPMKPIPASGPLSLFEKEMNQRRRDELYESQMQKCNSQRERTSTDRFEDGDGRNRPSLRHSPHIDYLLGAGDRGRTSAGSSEHPTDPNKSVASQRQENTLERPPSTLSLSARDRGAIVAYENGYAFVPDAPTNGRGPMAESKELPQSKFVCPPCRPFIPYQRSVKPWVDVSALLQAKRERELKERRDAELLESTLRYRARRDGIPLPPRTRKPPARPKYSAPSLTTFGDADLYEQNPRVDQDVAAFNGLSLEEPVTPQVESESDEW